jgi:hypothetical protein
MKKLIIGLGAIALVGCAGTKQLGNINPGNLGPVLSQDNANVDVNASTPYGNLSIHRIVPTAKDSTPVVPLSGGELASITNDPVANLLYGFRNDTASVNIQWQGVGGSITIQRSMPPTTNAPIKVIVVNTATNPVPSIVSTNTVTP